MGNTFGLSVSPDDSVYLSFEGGAGPVGLSLNLDKNIDDITNAGHWDVKDIGKFVNWYNDRLLSNIHFAKNGNWYSSGNGSINTGGSYFSFDEGRTWVRHQYGLGLNVYGQFSRQTFVENSMGTVCMVQLLDERVYRVATSGPISLPGAKAPLQFHLYPNPTTGNVKLMMP